MSDRIKKDNISIEQIIAKIDNDFNPDNTDWIPRVAAWVTDALLQLDVNLTKRKRISLPIRNRIGISQYSLRNAIIYDKCGNRIPEATTNASDCPCNGSPSTGDLKQTATASATDTSETICNEDANNAPDQMVSEQIAPNKYNIYEFELGCDKQRNYVLIDDTKIELNFDTDCIQLEYDFIETQESELYGCELPMIPNDGVLIEALTYFCMYKMLTRGYKHPVMNLAASQYGTNPYYIWLQMKEQAKRSIINRNFDRDMDDSSRMFRSALYIDTFDPKRS